MLSQTRPLAPSTSLIRLYVSSADANLSVILLNTPRPVPVYSQYTSTWPFSSAERTAALPMPASRFGLKPLAFSSSTVIAVMICCSVNALPPTTIVCAAALMLSAAARIPPQSILIALFIVPPGLASRIPQRIDAARYQPILHLPEQEIHGYREQRGRDRACQHHPVLLQVDTGEDKLAQPAAADQESDRRGAYVDSHRRAYAGEDHEQRVRQLDPAQDRAGAHAHSMRSVDQMPRHGAQSRVGVAHDGKQRGDPQADDRRQGS